MATQLSPKAIDNNTLSVRPARLTDHFAMARLTARAFHDDVLFGHIIHPYRHKYPSHMSRYWLSRNLVEYFDWSHRFVVAIARSQAGREVIVGQIHWSRMSMSNTDPVAACWALPWWDSRRLLRPLLNVFVWVASRTFWPNRAADPAKEQIIEQSYGFLDHVWDSAKGRSPSWYIESMAVDPSWQGRGVGRMLVEEGLKLAEEEGVSASVISAEGKEGFYRRCGFVTGPVGRSGEGEGNPLWSVPGGLVFFREKPRCRQSQVDEGREVETCMEWLKRDNEAGWRCGWIERGGVD